VMNMKGFGRKRAWRDRGNIPGFTCRREEKLQNNKTRQAAWAIPPA